MKKIFLIFSILCMLIILSSCKKNIEWKSLSSEYIEEVKVMGYDFDENGFVIMVRLRFPEELLESESFMYGTFIRLYFDVEYSKTLYFDTVYYTYNEVPLDILIKKSGYNEFYCILNLEEYKDIGYYLSVTNITYDKAVYSTMFKGFSIENYLSSSELAIFKVVFPSLLISSIVYITLVILLGIKINKNITKQYYKNKYSKL